MSAEIWAVLGAVLVATITTTGSVIVSSRGAKKNMENRVAEIEGKQDTTDIHLDALGAKVEANRRDTKEDFGRLEGKLDQIINHLLGKK